jgi:hypothetical protein
MAVTKSEIISRRDFLRLTGGLAEGAVAAWVLAACGIKPTELPPTPEPGQEWRNDMPVVGLSMAGMLAGYDPLTQEAIIRHTERDFVRLNGQLGHAVDIKLQLPGRTDLMDREWFLLQGSVGKGVYAVFVTPPAQPGELPILLKTTADRSLAKRLRIGCEDLVAFMQKNNVRQDLITATTYIPEAIVENTVSAVMVMPYYGPTLRYLYMNGADTALIGDYYRGAAQSAINFLGETGIRRKDNHLGNTMLFPTNDGQVTPGWIDWEGSAHIMSNAGNGDMTMGMMALLGSFDRHANPKFPNWKGWVPELSAPAFQVSAGDENFYIRTIYVTLDGAPVEAELLIPRNLTQASAEALQIDGVIIKGAGEVRQHLWAVAEGSSARIIARGFNFLSSVALIGFMVDAGNEVEPKRISHIDFTAVGVNQESSGLVGGSKNIELFYGMLKNLREKTTSEIRWNEPQFSGFREDFAKAAEAKLVDAQDLEFYNDEAAKVLREESLWGSVNVQIGGKPTDTFAKAFENGDKKLVILWKNDTASNTVVPVVIYEKEADQPNWTATYALDTWVSTNRLELAMGDNGSDWYQWLLNPNGQEFQLIRTR